MPTIHDRSLARFTHEVKERRQANPDAKLTESDMDRLVSIIGDTWLRSEKSLENDLKRSHLLPEQKLNVARQGMSSREKADLKTLLSDQDFLPALDPVALNFLKALVGLEPLHATDSLTAAGADASSAVGSVNPASSPELAAVKKMRELVKSGQLSKYYDAAIGIGGDAALKDEALKLFGDLPQIQPGEINADKMVALGLWTTAPRGVEAMQKSARFLPGRQVLAPAKLNTNTGAGQKFLAWQDDGQDALTYRATLAGERGDNYLVTIDGKDDPIEVPKSRIHELNQPNVFSGERISMAKTADYKSPFMKAKLAEAAIKMDSLVGQLEFTKHKSTGLGGFIGALFGRGDTGKPTSQIQRDCVRVVHDVINMKYPKGDVYSEQGRDSGQDAGRLAVKGIGSCYQQGSVMAGLLAPFGEMLGVDIQFISGGVYRNTNSSDPADKQFRSFNSQAHGWLQLTYRPSMELRICDRTWQQPDHPADKAYSKWGDRYPKSRYRLPVAEVAGTDVNMSGDVSTTTFERQFGEQGVDGRDNHMGNAQ